MFKITLVKKPLTVQTKNTEGSFLRSRMKLYVVRAKNIGFGCLTPSCHDQITLDSTWVCANHPKPISMPRRKLTEVCAGCTLMPYPLGHGSMNIQICIDISVLPIGKDENSDSHPRISDMRPLFFFASHGYTQPQNESWLAALVLQ